MSLTERTQAGILSPVPVIARSLTFRIDTPGKVGASLRRFAAEYSSDCGIVGLGEPCTRALDVSVPGLRTFPAMSGPGYSVPSTQEALWVRLCGPDRGVVFDSARIVQQLLSEAFVLSATLDTFTYHGGRDLTRFEDGTENPKGDDELEDAPASAHIKRSEQESFEPAAFMLRRSMPWAGAEKEGLEFVSFVASLDTYERVMRHMTGLDDGIVDGLFSFSRPVTGGYYWCPPVADGHLDLSFLPGKPTR